MLELADDFAMEMTQGPALHGPAGRTGVAGPLPGETWPGTQAGPETAQAGPERLGAEPAPQCRARSRRARRARPAEPAGTGVCSSRPRRSRAQSLRVGGLTARPLHRPRRRSGRRRRDRRRPS